MKRKDFLRSAGILGAASVLPVSKVVTNTFVPSSDCGGACVLIPSETEGPFPLDLSANNFYFRKDIRETQSGVELRVKLKIIGSANCLPMSNVRVNIWHCTKEGLYSGYDNNQNRGQAGLTYLRGYQITDANGEVDFVTIFPGWYTGRIAHIHFKVTVSTSYSAVSQLTWDLDKKNAIYTANPSIYTKGIDPLAIKDDNIFSDGSTLQIASLEKNIDGSYSTTLEVTVNGTGVTGLGHIEKENAKQFTLGQNIPNPVMNSCVIPFSLVKKSKVAIELWNVEGKKLKEICNQNLPAGDHTVELDFEKLQLPRANYAYQIIVSNEDGTFIDSKLLTVAN